MAEGPNASVAFLPWVRQGAAAAINVADTLGSNMRGAVDLKATLAINNVPGNAVTVRLRGPADVVGIDPHEIVRMDPKPNTTDFEPNYFPGIEFDRPDFPWLFTPAMAGADAKLRPWLCLVVVRQQDGVILSSTAESPLAILSIGGAAKPVEELPDLVDSWAWVHAQVAVSKLAETDSELMKQDMRTRPERSLSRLLCPRILQPSTDYVACVVPTFELGCRAGLGEEIKDTDLTAANALKPAWSFTLTPPESVRLPVYHHWRFRTGEGGDFESLVRLLHAEPAPEGLGKRPMDISEPGFRLEGFPDEAQLALEGALRPLEKRELAPWPEHTQELFQGELAKIVNAAGEALDIDPDSDPLLAPPLYGQWHAARSTIATPAEPWFDDLNLDPRHRSVAAFGTRVVQEYQEALMASAWEQAGDLKRANQRMRQLQLSLAASTSLHERHFAKLGDEAILRVSAPALARINAAGAMGETGTLAQVVSSRMLPLQAASTAMRRIARERGPITRRIAAQGLIRAATPNWMAILNSPAAFTFLTPPLPNMATFAAVRANVTQPAVLSQFREVTAETVANMAQRPHFRISPEGQEVFHAGRYQPVPPVPETDNPTALNFRNAARDHLEKVDPGRIGIIFAQAPTLPMQEIRVALMTQTEPRRTLVPLAQAIVAMGENTTARPPTNTGIVPIEPIMAAPKFPQPMYESLRDLSQQLLLPGLETIEPNSVLGLETNSRFVEAYMVGLNHEMGRELLWRGYPTDQRGTYFDHFWDSRSMGGDPDVNPIHTWHDRPLGDPQTAPAGDRFVMLMRSALLRRYPSAAIYAAKAVRKTPTSVRKPTLDHEMEAHPVFRGSMDPDVTFFGFNLTVEDVVGKDTGTGQDDGYFIVIQEQPGEPRFGYDEGAPLNEGTHLKESFGAPQGSMTGPRGGGPPFQWGKNGAHIAAMLRQQPMRIAIHASQFVKKPS
jgi:hypothetical protein